MSTDKSSEVKRFNNLFEVAINAQRASGHRSYKKECEEFYYNDVKKTRTQWDKNQKDKIQKTYNIPVSTKFGYAINEQMLAFLTSNKPFARLITAEESQKEWVYAYQKAYQCVWYESKINKCLNNVLREGLGPGEGFLYVRPAYHQDEATTGVVVEHKNWKHFFVDPESRIWDYSDAEYVGIMDVMRTKKAEEYYDIKIPDTERVTDQGIPNVEDLANDFTAFGSTDKKDLSKYVWIKEFFEKKDKNVYIGNDIDTDDVIVSLKRPESIEIPNPEKAKLGMQLMAVQQELQSKTANVQSAEGQQEFAANNAEAPVNDVEQIEQGSQDMMANQDIQAESEEVQMLKEQLSYLEQMYNEMADEVPAFKMLLEGNKGKPTYAITLNVTRSIKKRILYTLQVGDTILEKKILPSDRYPIINFPFLSFGSPNRVFGNTHFIMDVIKAMNKYVSEIMYDIAINGHRRGFIHERAIVDPATFENDLSTPGKMIKYKTVQDDKNLGLPTMMDPSPLSQSMTYMLDYFKQLIEYITGIYGVMQGDSGSAPETFGATQSLQSFGTQRIKLYSRNIESSLENLAYVIVHYIQAYAPRDKVMKYFDENGDGQEVSLMNTKEDLQFKVRVEITSSLPTTRQMSLQLLAFITQTVSDDALKALYTQYMLKMQDVPEADKMAEEIDIIRSLQSQIEQAGQQIEQLTGQVKAAENNMQQMQIKSNVDSATAKADKSLALSAMEQENEMANMEIPKELLSINDEVPTEEEI